MSPLSPASGLVSYCEEHPFSGRTQELLYRAPGPLPPRLCPLLPHLPAGLGLRGCTALCFLKLLLPPEGPRSLAKLLCLDGIPPPDSAGMRSFPDLSGGGEFGSRAGWAPAEEELKSLENQSNSEHWGRDGGASFGRAARSSLTLPSFEFSSLHRA